VLPNLLPGRWAEFGFGMVAASLHASGRLGRWAPRAGWAILALVPLTTVAVPSRQMGQIAANLLLKHLRSPSEYRPECVKLSQNLIVRSSTTALVNKSTEIML